MARRSKRACGLCGRDPAEGFAAINGVRYCHGDGEALTCYMRSGARYLEPTAAGYAASEIQPQSLPGEATATTAPEAPLT